MHAETSKTRTVGDLKPGEQARVSTICGAGAIRQRLLDVGLLPAVSIVVERVAPAGDPIWIRFGSLQMSLRRSEARRLLVEDLP